MNTLEETNTEIESFLPKEAHEGQIYFDINNRSIYIFKYGNWELFSRMQMPNPNLNTMPTNQQFIEHNQWTINEINKQFSIQNQL